MKKADYNFYYFLICLSGFCNKVVLAPCNEFGIAICPFLLFRGSIDYLFPKYLVESLGTDVKVQGFVDFSENLRVKASCGAYPPCRIPACKFWPLQIQPFCVRSAMQFKRFLKHIFAGLWLF